MGAGGARFRGFTWRPLGRREPVVRDLDLEIGPGERVLLLGASGAGKSIRNIVFTSRFFKGFPFASETFVILTLPSYVRATSCSKRLSGTLLKSGAVPVICESESLAKMFWSI